MRHEKRIEQAAHMLLHGWTVADAVTVTGLSRTVVEALDTETLDAVPSPRLCKHLLCWDAPLARRLCARHYAMVVAAGQRVHRKYRTAS